MGNVFGRTSQINKIKFFVTGSEAVEASIEVAKNISKGSILLTNKYGFHGWTHFASACSDFPEFGRFVDEAGHYTRKKKENTRYFEYPTCSSCPYGKTKKRCVEEKELYCIKKIRDQIEEIGAKNIIAVCTDCMLGLAGIIPPPQYIPQLYKVLKEYGLIWIDDEIYSAFRLGKWFAYQEYSNVEPDIVCFGKSFSNGISPLSGIALSAKITSKLVNQKWQICSSFAANPVALTAALYNLKFIEDNRILEAVEEKGALLSMLLWHLKQRFPFIKEIRGKGLFWIIELEGEKNVNQYRHVSAKGEVSSFSLLRNQCIKNGVLIGSYLGNSIRISPALTITCEEIFNAYELLNISFEQYQNLARK